jgi:S-(hydroxymethyl)glutathione dehydrogenase/alcohol dehydrogenase
MEEYRMPLTSRAAILFEYNTPLRIETIEVRDPGPEDVLIKLAAASLCHSDLSFIEGKFQTPLPTVLGHEGFGHVLAVGSDVKGLAKGDPVVPYLVPDCGKCPYCLSGRTNLCVEMGRSFNPEYQHWFSYNGEKLNSFLALGTFSEYIVVPQEQVQKVNAKAPAGEASCIGCGISTGLGSALLHAKVEAGSSVVVFGMGGVGLSCVQGAKIAGAKMVIGVDINPDKEEAARAMGATHFINGATQDPVTEVFKLTGLGADYAFDCAGSPKIFELALASLSSGGWAKMTTVGIIPDDKPVPVKWGQMTGRNWSSTLMGGAKRQDVGRFIDWYVDGTLKLDQLISGKIKLDEINHGFDLMREGKTNRTVIYYD